MLAHAPDFRRLVLAFHKSRQSAKASQVTEHPARKSISTGQTRLTGARQIINEGGGVKKPGLGRASAELTPS